ncbi:predicted protein [Nematostella vectensis]|uniref:Uncharacterized protein n=2 Tax=Nematostella vectensis TaxID=45351 RepID=A7SSJ3_NEMVE|nr:predicted protein [Nematostella vectensis]|eukprot:XP_001625430.1 predicted protein [Nematostella vectensis]
MTSGLPVVFKPSPLEKENNVETGHYLEKGYETNAILIAGHKRNDQPYLVIGVPTVQRSEASYLMDTLQALIDGLDENDKKHVMVVVFVADLDNSNHAAKMSQQLSKKFSKELDSGLIQAVTAPASYYPKLTGLPQLYQDSPQRVYWRSKQCVDYAFLFGYAGSLGKYYMQLEDDVIARKGYFKATKNFINRNVGREWLFLEMGYTGFIGMVFKSKDTRRLSVFYKMYYWVWPIDFLFRHFSTFDLYGNNPRYHPPQFVHIGKVSSLKGQIRKLTSEEMLVAQIKPEQKAFHLHENPPAKISTTMTKTVDNIDIRTAYSGQEHVSGFWSKTVQNGDSITIIFNETMNIYKAVFISGNRMSPQDSFGSVRLETSQASANGSCEIFVKWKDFNNKANVTAEMPTNEAITCKCLRLVITQYKVDNLKRIRWLAIREIAVWATSTN